MTSSALDDNVVSLNMSSGTMDTVKLKNEILSTGSMQATSNSSITDILKHETTLAYVSINPSTSRGNVLYSTPINPGSFVSAGLPSRVSWISKLYKYWRGDLKFRFVFTKTILQQTKVLAVFVPGASINDPAPQPDACYFYSHKVLMNPANETEWTLSVPFISETPFRTMNQPTGMLYLILFQQMVVSSADASDIYMSIFVAGDPLQFHEFVQLPVQSAANLIDPADAWSIESFNSVPLVATSSGTRTFLSDSGVTLATSLGDSQQTADVNVINGQPIAASPLLGSQVAYDASLMRSIVGAPFGDCSSYRVIGFIQANVGTVAPLGSFAYLTVYLWPDGSVAIGPASATPMTRASVDVIPTYSVVFPSTFTNNTTNFASRLAQLEASLTKLSAILKQK